MAKPLYQQLSEDCLFIAALAPVVQRVGSFIHWIGHKPADDKK